MNKISSKLLFFSGKLNNYSEIPLKEIPQNYPQKNNEPKLAYTDKNFSLRDTTFSSFVNNPLTNRKV